MKRRRTKVNPLKGQQKIPGFLKTPEMSHFQREASPDSLQGEASAEKIEKKSQEKTEIRAADDNIRPDAVLALLLACRRRQDVSEMEWK